MNKKFKLYQQVAYIPWHARKANGGQGINDPDIELGFIMSIPPKMGDGQDYFVRYWRRDHPGVLRTTANSERTPGDCLVAPPKRLQIDQAVVIKAVESILDPHP
jgi:hypothetical protein